MQRGGRVRDVYLDDHSTCPCTRARHNHESRPGIRPTAGAANNPTTQARSFFAAGQSRLGGVMSCATGRAGLNTARWCGVGATADHWGADHTRHPGGADAVGVVRRPAAPIPGNVGRPIWGLDERRAALRRGREVLAERQVGPVRSRRRATTLCGRIPWLPVLQIIGLQQQARFGRVPTVAPRSFNPRPPRHPHHPYPVAEPVRHLALHTSRRDQSHRPDCVKSSIEAVTWRRWRRARCATTGRNAGMVCSRRRPHRGSSAGSAVGI